jgi:hypothetical protein
MDAMAYTTGLLMRSPAAALAALFLACGSEPSATPGSPDSGSDARAATGGSGGAVGSGGAAGTGATSAGSGGVATSEPAFVSVDGTIAEVAFTARGGAARRFYWSGDELVQGGGSGEILAGISFAISEYEDPCHSVRDTTRPILAFYLRDSRPELSPGTFPLVDSWVTGGTDSPPQGTLNVLGLYPESCGVTNLDWAVSGDIEITRVTGSQIEGSFEALLETNGVISGEFVIDECPTAKAFPDDTDPTIACGIL